MEDKTKIETTPTTIHQQPLENNKKIKTALTTNNQWKKKTKIETTPTKYLPIATRKQQNKKLH